MRNWTDSELFLEWDQRAAKMQHDGCMSMSKANRLAAEELSRAIAPRKLPDSIHNQIKEDEASEHNNQRP